jgi:hypothetical protein
MDDLAFAVVFFAVILLLPGIAVVVWSACAELDFVAEARIRHAFKRRGGADIDKVERIVGPLDINSFVGFPHWTADDAVDFRRASKSPRALLEEPVA